METHTSETNTVVMMETEKERYEKIIEPVLLNESNKELREKCARLEAENSKLKQKQDTYFTALEKGFQTDIENQISFEQLVKPKQLRDFLPSIDSLDTNAPFQRPSVWSPTRKKKLIHRMLKGGNINSIYIVPKDKYKKEYWVLDGNQRLLTILDFVKGKLTVSVRIKGQDFKNLTYSQLCDENHPAHILYGSFMDSTLIICEYKEALPLWAQILEFENINECTPLTANQRVYRLNPLFSKFLDEILVIAEDNLKSLCHDSLLENNKDIFYRLIHDILCLSFGYDFNDKYNARETHRENIRNSAKKIELILADKGLHPLHNFKKEYIDFVLSPSKYSQLCTAMEWLNRSREIKGCSNSIY